MPRLVSVVLCLPDGAPLGEAAPFEVSADTYWPDVRGVAAAAQRAWAVSDPPTILRLVRVDPATGEVPEHVTYTAEVSANPGLELSPAPGDVFAEVDSRMPWARPGGWAEQLEWAREALDAQGIGFVGPAQQIRSWNLSSLWRLPTTEGMLWLKAVPPFFAHEGLVIERLQRFAVPRLRARANGVCVLAEVPGDDLYAPEVSVALPMIDLLLEIQTGARLSDLRSSLPDWSPRMLGAAAEHTLREAAPALEPDDRRAIEALISRLDRLADALDACGLPDTLVHGDFHPGNLRGSPDAMTLLDWGDAGFGHPLYDHAAFVERMSAEKARAVTDHWLAAWSVAVPGSDPARALDLIAPIGALRQATLYRAFLDGIEPDERVYHRDDPAIWLRRTAAATRPRR